MAASRVISLSASLKEKQADIDLLQQTFTEIGSELDLDRVFRIVSVRARELIDAKTLLIPLLDENLETYTYRGGSGENAEEIIGQSLPMDFGICGWVWKHKKAWWPGMFHELNEEDKRHWREESNSVILVPLQGRKHFLGGIAGIGKTNGRAFDKRDLNLLQLFASIVSIAIENAMAIKAKEASNRLNQDYQQRLEVLNRCLSDSNQELEYLSLYDTITTLPNRSLFQDRLTQSIGRASLTGSNVSLLLIDLDQFKRVNEAFGHDGGDRLLKEVADRFAQDIRSTETIARLGGDEFVVILPDHDSRQATQRAHTLREQLADEFDIEGTRIAISASIGIAVCPIHGKDPGQLLSHADTAMYTAKHNNLGVSVYDDDMNHLTRNHLTMVAGVRRALENRQFVLHFQPKIAIPSRRILSAEALGRWTSTTWGVVPPNIFIEQLEQIGLINDYTCWAIRTALAQAKRWNDTGQPIRVAVNISPHTLMHPDFCKELETMISTRSEGELLIFEITENLFLSEYDRLQDVLRFVSRVGIQLSIDDYGTGYSSLSRLRKLPVTELKIDQSFIKDMLDDNDNRAIVRSTIDLAHNLGLTVVAEGVETQDTLELLHELGCDAAQGYLIGKPMPVSDFDAYLRNRTLS